MQTLPMLEKSKFMYPVLQSQQTFGYLCMSVHLLGTARWKDLLYFSVPCWMYSRKKLCNEELHDVYSSPDIIKMIKCVVH
jgi:hypothetical protein